jgi:hypothetical protein
MRSNLKQVFDDCLYNGVNPILENKLFYTHKDPEMRFEMKDLSEPYTGIVFSTVSCPEDVLEELEVEGSAVVVYRVMARSGKCLYETTKKLADIFEKHGYEINRSELILNQISIVIINSDISFECEINNEYIDQNNPAPSVLDDTICNIGCKCINCIDEFFANEFGV